jgi:hypothetical protein
MQLSNNPYSEYIYLKMRNDDRSRLRQHQNQITIEYPSQIIQISSDSYGSLLNQNIRLGSNKICITQNGQQVRPCNQCRSVLLDQVGKLLNTLIA